MKRGRKCQFCPEPAVKGVLHEGKPVCVAHNRVRREYVAAMKDAEETETIAAAYHARVAARQAVSTSGDVVEDTTADDFADRDDDEREGPFGPDDEEDE